MSSSGVSVKWHESLPSDQSQARQTDDEFRSLKTDLRTGLDLEHEWPSTAGVVNRGLHRRGSGRAYVDVQSNLSTSNSTEGQLYFASDTSGLFVSSGGTWFNVSQNRFARSANITSVTTFGTTSRETLMSVTLPSLSNGDSVEYWSVGSTVGQGTTGNTQMRIHIGTAEVQSDQVANEAWGFSGWFVKDGSAFHHLGREFGAGDNIQAGEAVDPSGATLYVSGQASGSTTTFGAETLVVKITRTP